MGSKTSVNIRPRYIMPLRFSTSSTQKIIVVQTVFSSSTNKQGSYRNYY